MVPEGGRLWHHINLGSNPNTATYRLLLWASNVPLGFSFPLREMGMALCGCYIDLCGHGYKVRVARFRVIAQSVDTAISNDP